MRDLLAAIVLLAASPAMAEALYNTPVYDPASKSYWSLVDVHDRRVGYHAGYEWRDAAADAARSEYKGVHGRLAIVASAETHEFLLRTFRPTTDAWIGLRYMCETRLLIDSAGHSHAKTAFAPWDANWKQDIYICVVNPYTHKYE